MSKIDPKLKIQDKDGMDDFSPEEMREFNESLKSMNSTMGSLGQALTKLVKDLGDASTASKESSESSKKASDSKDEETKKSQKLSEAEESAKDSVDKFQKSLGYATTALGSFSGALLSGVEGFGKYDKAVEGMGDAAKTAGAAFGPLGKAIGTVVDAFAKLASVMMKQTDAQNTFVKEINLMGGIAKTNSQELTDLARAAGYSAQDLDLLTPIIKKVGAGLTTFGNGTTDGIKDLMKVFALSDEQEASMRRYGYTLEEAQEQQANYILMQRNAGIALNKKDFQEGELQKRTIKYSKSLVILSELTGKQSDEIKSQQMQVAMEMQNRVANVKRQNDIDKLVQQAANETDEAKKAELTARAKSLQEEEDTRKAAMNRFSATMGPEFNTQLQRVLRTGAFDESTKALSMMGFQAGELKKQFENVKVDTPEYDALISSVEQQFRDGVLNQIDTFGGAAQYMGEEAQSFLASVGVTKETLDSMLAMDKDRAKQSKDTADAIESSTTEGADAQKDVATELQVFERNVRTASDEFLDAINPFNGALSLGEIAIGAFTAALGIATIALAGITKMGGAGFLDKIPGMKGKSGMMKTAGNFVKRNAFKLAGATAVVGTAAYSGYAEARDGKEEANKKYLASDMTNDDKLVRDDEKSEANVKGVTVAGSALAGAALGTAIAGPLGTIVGGMIGGIIGAAAKDKVADMATTDDDIESLRSRQELEKVKDLGIYDEDFFGKSELDLDKLAAQVEANAITPEMVKAMIDDDDVTNSDMEELKKLYGKLGGELTDNTDATKDDTDATKDNAEATKDNADATKKSTDKDKDKDKDAETVTEKEVAGRTVDRTSEQIKEQLEKDRQAKKEADATDAEAKAKALAMGIDPKTQNTTEQQEKVDKFLASVDVTKEQLDAMVAMPDSETVPKEPSQAELDELMAKGTGVSTPAEADTQKLLDTATVVENLKVVAENQAKGLTDSSIDKKLAVQESKFSQSQIDLQYKKEEIASQSNGIGFDANKASPMGFAGDNATDEEMRERGYLQDGQAAFDSDTGDYNQGKADYNRKGRDKDAADQLAMDAEQEAFMAEMMDLAPDETFAEAYGSTDDLLKEPSTKALATLGASPQELAMLGHLGEANTPGRAPVDHFNKIADPVVDIEPELENTDLAASTEDLKGELAQSDSAPGGIVEKLDALIQVQVESNMIAKRGADASVEIADTNQKIATNSMV